MHAVTKKRKEKNERKTYDVVGEAATGYNPRFILTRPSPISSKGKRSTLHERGHSQKNKKKTELGNQKEKKNST
jgi:hypothetical protein